MTRALLADAKKRTNNLGYCAIRVHGGQRRTGLFQAFTKEHPLIFMATTDPHKLPH